MNEWPPNSVLVIDNASFHEVAGIREMVEERGSRLLYLSAYSPGFNPIEFSFSNIKAWLSANQDHQDRVDQALDSEEGTLYDLFREAAHSVTMENAKAWYKHCGYNVPE